MASLDTTSTARFPRRLYLLAATFLFIFMGAGAQQAYLVPYLGRVTRWSPVLCSSVIATVYASMLVFRVANVYLFAGWSDRRFTIVGSLAYLYFMAAMAATTYFESYAFAIASAVLWGMGGAMMWTGTTMQTLAVADEAGGRHGTGIGVLYSATHAGWVTGVVLLGLVYRALPTERLPLLYALAAALTLIGNALATRLPATSHPRRATLPPRALLALATQGPMVVSGVLQLMSALAFGLILGVFSRYVESAYGAQWIWVSMAFYPLTRMVASFVVGRLADRVGHVPVLCGGFLAGAAGLLISRVWNSPAAAVLTSLALGLLSSAVPVVATAIIGSSADRAHRPLAHGIVFSWRDLGVAAAAVGASILGLQFDLHTAFVVFAGVFTACAALSLLLTRYRPAPQRAA